MHKKLNLAIIGLGRAGKIHYKNVFLSNKCVLKYALDVDNDKLLSFEHEYSSPTTSFLSSDKYATVLDDADLNGVIITTPTICHEEQILMALEKGKSVFCEKPIAVSEEAIKRCYELAEKNKLVLHCSLNRRYDPSLQQLHRAMVNKELGRIHMIKTCSRDSPKPHLDYLKISNGIFHDCGVHDLDIVCWLLKRKPSTVYATAFTNDPVIASINDSETVVISMTFDDGTLAVIDLSRQSTYGYDQRVEIHGDRGMIESLNQRPNNVQISNSSGTLLPPLLYSFPSRYKESYENSLDEFLECVMDRKPSSVSVDDVLVLSQLAEACEVSYKTRQMVRV